MPDPPAPFRWSTSGAIEIRQGGGILAWVGYLFFIAFFLAVRFEDATGDKIAVAVTLLVIGACMVTGRRIVRVDRATGSVTRRLSVLGLALTRNRSLAEFNAIVLKFAQGDSESPDTYPVGLRAVSGKDFILTSGTTYGISRKQAEFLSSALRMPLADATTDHIELLTPDRAAETLQERLRRNATASAPAPFLMRSTVTQSAGEWTIIIPQSMSKSAGAALAMLGLIVLVVAVPVFFLFLYSHSATGPLIFLLIGILSLVFGVYPLKTAAEALGFIPNRVVVAASPAGLRIERKNVFGTRAQTIPAAAILDVDSVERAPLATRHKGIIVKTTEALIPFGERLPPDELHFLVAVIRKALAGTR
jgi:hypothetical protein